MLLTDEEIALWLHIADEPISFARAIESAVLKKLNAQEPDAWQIRNGLCHAGIRGNQLDAELTAANMQKCHDLGGSLAAFNVRPLYAHPLPPDDVVRDAERLDWIQANCRCDPMMDGQHKWWPTNFNKCLTGPSIRDAIDAAMKEMK